MFIGHAAVALAAKPLLPRINLAVPLAAAFWGLIGFLLIAYLGNVFGPPPPDVQAIAIAGIAGGVLFTAWSWWADRHRGFGGAL